MGVIIRQSLKHSIVRYIGVLIGVVSMLKIYPLEWDMIGEIRFILSTSSLLMSFGLLGVNSLTIRFFPNFKNEDTGHHGFLGLLLLGVLLTLSTTGLALFVFRDTAFEMLSLLKINLSELRENIHYIGLLIALLALIGILAAYSSNFQRIVIPDLLQNFSLKIILPLLILAFHFSLLNRSDVKTAYVLVHVLIAMALLYYIYSLGQLKLKINFSFLSPRLMKQMGVYSLYGIIGSIGSILVTRIDYFMVTTMLETSYFGTGIYDFAVNITGVIIIPYTAFTAIAAPIIAGHIQTKAYKDTLDVYQRSSLVLMIAGLGLFLSLWISIDELFLITPDPAALQPVKYVVFFLGLSKLIDMTTGLNGHIIAFSEYFRFNVLVLLLLGLFNVVFNFYFLPRYGITGAAIATFISLACFNLTKFVFVWYKMGLQPFTLRNLQVLLFASIAYGLAAIIPGTGNYLLDIAIHSGLFALVFALLVLMFKVSDDVNQLYASVLSFLKIKR
ncbi:MAG TPA: oligosaccharide flippase family protein [Saprospiraceae bacterium]|nr:oligosaccharide flippase family protein [Saprospiraceae bacterium]